MHDTTGSEIAEFSSLEMMESEAVMKGLDPERFDKIQYYGLVESGKVYGKEFSGSKMQKCRFTKCEFHDVAFSGTTGSASSFKHCVLKNCTVENANFDFADFQGSFLLSDSPDANIVSSGFNHSNFSDANWEGVSFSGCSFDSAHFQNTTVKDSKCKHCNFENAHFENAAFENIDLSRASLDYSTMENVSFNNVTLPITGILHAFHGLNNVEKNGTNVDFKFPDSEVKITLAELLSTLERLQPFFFKINDFFVLANTQIYHGNSDLAFKYIQAGVTHSLQFMDFRMVGYYCKLASLNYTFRNESLRQLYEMLKSDRIVGEMTTHEYQTYLFEMDRIKRLLIDRPFGQPQMKISLETDINLGEVEDSKLIGSLFRTLEEGAPQAIHHLEVRHNSPYWFDLILSDSLPSLFSYGAYFLSAFMAGSAIVSEFLKRADQYYSVQVKRNTLQKGKIELEEMKRRQESATHGDKRDRPREESASVPAAVRERILNISVTIRADQELPKELREFTVNMREMEGKGESPRELTTSPEESPKD